MNALLTKPIQREYV